MKAEYVDHLGDDLRVVNAARVSFDKESEWDFEQTVTPKGNFTDPVESLSVKDQKLISYLATHGHWSPFSHPQITLRYTVPIFVARQEFKHIVGFTRNEVSRRYVDDEPEFFVPDVWRSRPEGSVKQGSGGEEVKSLVSDLLAFDGKGGLTPSHHIDELYDHLLESARRLYLGMVEAGVAPEQARMVLPQSMYTSYYITGSLAAFARFYRQRTDSHAQVEIQELAHQVGAIVEPLFPCSWTALTEL